MTSETKLNTNELRKAFSQYPTGVVALAATIDDEDHVMVASSFMTGISLDPPLVSVAVQKKSSTWSLLKDAKYLGVSFLGQHQDELCRQLSSKDKNLRWDGVSRKYSANGALRLHDCATWLECSIYAEYEAGDHKMVLLEVNRLEVCNEVEPLIFYCSGFRQLMPKVMFADA